MTTRWWPSVPEIAAAVADALGQGDEARALRLLIDGVNRLDAAIGRGELSVPGAMGEALAPGTVGVRRWDGLLCGVLRYRLHQRGLRAPAWTLVQPLDQFWWPVRANASKEYNDMANSPAELIRLGIFMDERSLGSL